MNTGFTFLAAIFNFNIFFKTIVSFVFFKRLLTYLHILQQDTYSTSRFMSWFFRNRAFDRYMTTAIFICMTIGWLIGIDPNNIILKIIALSAILLLSISQKSPLNHAKKCLVMTHRALRILSVSLLLYIPIIITSDLKLTTLILIIQSAPFTLAIGNLITLPLETLIQRKYLKLAKETLSTLDPIIIGITGSYGKTSMKHILGHILSKYKPTLYTPGSVNTPMGICHVIQNKLQKNHHFFIVEMGAYHMGSIAKLCALTPPSIGAVTSIGPCHLERFGSMENIATGKSELLAAIEANKNHIGFSFPKELSKLDAFKKYIKSNLMITPLACTKKEQTVEGITVHIKENDTTTEIKAPIYGLHQADNIVLAVTIARKLGAPMELIKSALYSLKQVSARLEVSQDANHVTWINDGFNANPEGFKQAIDLLSQFGNHKKGRKILITPGIIELGNQHDEVHAKIAKYAMLHVDILIIVAPQRIDTFVRTAELIKKDKQTILKAFSFADAQKWLSTHLIKSDTVLIANDLPDVLETRPNI